MTSLPQSAKSVILYVDDDRDEHLLMQTALEQRQDIDLVCSFNRDEFFAQLDHRYPDVSYIFLDLNMPVVDGVELATELRSHARYAALPIIVITNGINSPQAKKLEQLGIAVVSKPSSFAALNKLVTDVFARLR